METLEDLMAGVEEGRLELVHNIVDSASDLPAPEGLPMVLYAARMAPEFSEVYSAAAVQMRADSDEALLLWLAAKGLALAEGKPRLAIKDGEAWSYLDCRPYIRASLGYARCCYARGEHNAAITELKALLAYDRADHVGARYLLAVVLLAATRFKAFLELRTEFEGDDSAYWLWMDAYHAVRANKRSAERKTIVNRALAANPHVPALLNSAQPQDAQGIDSYRLGSIEEAQIFAASEGGKLWRDDWRTLEALNRLHRA